MAHLAIEMDRGRGWECRQEGEIPNDTTIDQIALGLRAFADSHYRHRARLNGVVVAWSSLKTQRSRTDA